MKAIVKKVASALIKADNANAELAALLAENKQLPLAERMTKSELSDELKRQLGYARMDEKKQVATRKRISRLLAAAGYAKNHDKATRTKEKVVVSNKLKAAVVAVLKEHNAIDKAQQRKLLLAIAEKLA